MGKPECLGMQSLPRTNRKTIINKLPVLGKHSSFYNLITTIGIIIKEGMSKMFHVNADLVSTPSFQHTFNQCDIIESFKNFIMSDGFFPMVTFRIGFK